MKRLGLTVATFLIWGVIASTYYVCVVRGLCASETPIYKEVKQQTPTYVTPANVKSPDDFIVKKDTLSKKETIKTTIVAITKESIIDSLTQKGLEIRYQNQIVKSYPLNFRIYKANTLVRIPLMLSDYGTVLKDIMRKNNVALTIIGYYNETEDSIVGKQRAKHIEKLLHSASFPKEYVSIKSQEAKFQFDNYIFKGGIDFEFTPTDSIIVFQKPKR